MIVDVIQPKSLGAVPVGGLGPTNQGQLVYADGVNWNPGAGAGWYRWTGTAFIKLSNSIIWDKTVTGAAVTSVTTNGEVTLDGLAHGGYKFEAWIVENSATAIRLYYNNDQTNTNYDGTRISGAVNPAGVLSYNDATFLSFGYNNNTIHFVSGDISISPSGFIYATYTSYASDRAGTVNFAFIFGHSKRASAANLTRLDWVANANGIGVNSRFRLWGRT